MDKKTHGEHWSQFYDQEEKRFLYPTEFVVRTFLASYPNLSFTRLSSGQRVLDVGCGDGRNTRLLCEMGLEVSAVEIDDNIIHKTRDRLASLGLDADIRLGRNSKLPFQDGFFDGVLASAVCYYCDEGETIHDNLKEYARVLKTGGFLVASVADSESYIFNNAHQLDDGTFLISEDPYGCRVGYRLAAFQNRESVALTFGNYFENLSLGREAEDFFGIDQRLFWVVGYKKLVR